MPAHPSLPLLTRAAAIRLGVGGLVGLSALPGQRHHEPTTRQPLKCGIVHVGSRRPRIPVRFRLVAVMFVIFDLEAVNVIAWAFAAREAAWASYLEILVFNGVLAAAQAYLWRIGALYWRPGRIPEVS